MQHMLRTPSSISNLLAPCFAVDQHRYKELHPTVVSAVFWHRSGFCQTTKPWWGVLSSGMVRVPHLMHLRCLFFLESHFHFERQTWHLIGRVHRTADALSRHRGNDFCSAFPQAAEISTAIPLMLAELLLTSPSHGHLLPEESC